MLAPKDRPLRLLISCSPEDRELKEQLVRHLQVLVRFAGIELWIADRVQAGDNWREDVDAALDRADIALLLISADFLASDFLQDVELPKVFQRREQGGLRVIPVLLRSCFWGAHPWLGALKPLPASGRAIASFQGDGRDRALAEIVAEIAQRAGILPFRNMAERSPERVPIQDFERFTKTDQEIDPNRRILFRNWSRVVASDCVVELLRNFGGPCEYGLGGPSPDVADVSHEVVEFFYVKYIDRAAYIAVAVTHPVPRDVCHAAAPSLSFVEFLETSHGWTLGAVHVNALHAGAWGEPPSNIYVMNIGYNISAIVIDGGFTNQGFTAGYTVMYTAVAGEFKAVFQSDTCGHDSGTGRRRMDDWSADIQVVREGTSFYDLVVHRGGLRDGKAINERQVYRFDGRAYAPAGLYR
jgi:hypothetical protein